MGAKIYPALVLGLLLLVSCAPQQAQGPEGTILKAVPSTPSVGVGGEVVFDVVVENVEDLYGYQLDLAYDSRYLEFQKVEEGNFLGQGSQTFALKPTVESGVIKNIGGTRIGDVPGVRGIGVLARVSFTAKAAGDAKVGFPKFKLVDSDVQVVSATAESGRVEVS